MKQLIKQAEEIKFQSYKFIIEQRLKEFGSDITFYLWMYELKMWLRDKHKLDVYIESYSDSDTNIIVKWFVDIKCLKSLDLLYNKLNFKSPETALKNGLSKAIKLLK